MEDNSHRTLTDVSVDNVAKFLQTVVVVDDKARLESPSTNYENTKMLSIDKAEEHSPVGVRADLVSPEADTASTLPDPEDLDAKALVDGFAKEGIACTVLRPILEDDVVTQASKIAELADIVVLDWILGSDNGARATSLMRKMIEDGSSTDRMRLIAIYTGERDLRNVTDKAAEVLSERFAGDPERPSDFVAAKGPVRVAVFGKAHTRAPSEDTGLSERMVGISELPNRLILEFAEMTTGLLPNVAIAGLSEVRAQTHKLLTMFSRSLDPAYLGHRVLLPDPSEAEDQVVGMFVAEVLSILENGGVAKQAGIESIRAWLNEMASSESLRPTHLSVTSQDALLELLENGIDNTEGIEFGGWKWEKATHAFTSDDGRAEDANRQFAKMMHVKTQYGGPPPTLTLGTILCTESDQCATYWICLQPRCDAVRIDGSRAFPMVPMTYVADQRKDFEVVVPHREAWVLLCVPRKPAEIRMFTFKSSDSSRKQVTANRSDSTWIIKSIKGPSFEWVAQLKDEHAQRIANEFAGSFSRVGVNESEWVRRSGAKR